MKNKPIIVFDLDGVLFDSIELMREFNSARFVDIPRRELDELFTGNIYETIPNSPWPKREITEAQEEKRTADYVARKMSVPMYAGMKMLVEELARTHTLAVNTYARPERSRPLLAREGIMEYFDYIATYDPDMPKEDKTAKFKTIAARYGITMTDILFITDSLGDVRETAALGVPTIAVTWGLHERSFFEREPHPHLVAILDTVTELRDFLIEK